MGERLCQIGRKLKVRVDLEAKSRSWTKLMFDLEGDEEIWLGIVASLLRPMFIAYVQLRCSDQF